MNESTSLVAVAYVSSATRPFTPAELDALLLDAQAFNAQVGVSGALLHHDGSFFQYLEGPEAGVALAYARIKAARGHRGLIELVAAPVQQRHFATWSMGFAEPVASSLQLISQASWQSQQQAASIEGASSPGLALLLAYWQRAQSFRRSTV